jgi:hypothetical protein
MLRRGSGRALGAVCTPGVARIERIVTSIGRLELDPGTPFTTTEKSA